MGKRIMAVFLMLPFLGCWDPLPSLQTTALSGAATGLRKFEGRWFDEDGNLIAVVSERPEPELSVRVHGDLPLRGARLRDGAIVFRAGSDDPLAFSMQLTGSNKAVIDQGIETPGGFSPSQRLAPFCGFSFSTTTPLVRAPSSPWRLKMRKGARITAELAHEAYEGTFHWLAGVL
jgi:hypothetical protein